MAGDLEIIRNYCETDVLNTYLIYLRFDLMRGNLSKASYDLECDRVRTMLKTGSKPYLLEFLEAWNKEDRSQ